MEHDSAQLRDDATSPTVAAESRAEGSVEIGASEARVDILEAKVTEMTTMFKRQQAVIKALISDYD